MPASEENDFSSRPAGKTRLSREMAFQKLKHFCGYQERSHNEVKQKLYSFGLWKNEIEPIMARLIEENYLNEERFALQFAGGHFRSKQWGLVKIKYELKLRKISDYCIKKALQSIDENEYLKTLNTLAMKKWQSLKIEKNIFTRRKKVQDFLLQKGFEPLLIQDAIKWLSQPGK